MRHLIYASALLMLTSCGKDSACDQIEYSIEFEAQQGEEFCFPDDNSFQITQVNDNLCPCNTLCVSPGYISFDVDLTLEGEHISGTISNDPNLNEALMEPMLPNNYKIGIIDQNPPSSEICGTQINPKDFKFTLKISKN